MKSITIYFNFAAKSSAGHVEVDDDVNIEDVIKEWVALGYARVHLHANHQWIYVNWQNVVYASYDHAGINQLTS